MRPRFRFRQCLERLRFTVPLPHLRPRFRQCLERLRFTVEIKKIRNQKSKEAHRQCLERLRFTVTVTLETEGSVTALKGSGSPSLQYLIPRLRFRQCLERLRFTVEIKRKEER